MARIDALITKLELYFEHGEMHMAADVFQALVLPFRSKKSKRISPVRKEPRKGRETPAEHEAIKQQLFERANGLCEGARIRRDGGIVYEHAPNCPLAVPVTRGDPAHTKSRGSGGEWALENLRWLSRACHRWEHHGGKPVPKKGKD